MKTTVIVTTYNRPDALAVVLEGYCGQSDHDLGRLQMTDRKGDRRGRGNLYGAHRSR